jgi:hypothetical protein
MSFELLCAPVHHLTVAFNASDIALPGVGIALPWTSSCPDIALDNMLSSTMSVLGHCGH